MICLLALGAALGLSVPSGVAVAHEADYPNIVHPVVQFGTYGTALGQMIDPVNVAVGPDDVIYVAECGNNRIQAFDRTGRPIRAWGGPGILPGQFNCPAGIAVSSQGHVYVTDMRNDRVQVFDGTGLYLFTWGRS